MSKNKLYWTLQLSCWAVYVCYVALAIFFFTHNIKTVLVAAVINFSLFVILTHIYRLIVRKWNIESLNWYRFLIYPICANIIVSLIICLINSSFLNFANYFSPNHQFSIGYFTLQLLDTFRFAMPWFIFYHGIKYATKAVKSERDKNKAQMQLKFVELDSLKNQLNPHFLFNSLNSIRSLTLSDPKLAREATTKLSDLLRMSLTYNELQDISLQDELDLVKDYLSLEKIRFENRLSYRVEIDRSILKARVLPMSLQLLAENAVKHGIGKAKDGGEILIYAKKKDSDLVLGVRNSGNLTPENHTKNQRKGLGLANLRKRISINYGIADSLKIINQDNFVIAEFCIPLKIV
ncbi:MAG: histidine kinase [Arcicella sp.]|nr:histidine kinase [Arcicella sp.]